MSEEEDSLRLVIIADPKKDGIKVNPISIKGSYEEVEAELSKAIDLVFEKNDAVLSNAAIVSDAVKKAAEDKTKKSTEKKTGKPAPAAAPKKDDLFNKDAQKEEDVDDDDDIDDDEEEGTDVSDSKLAAKPAAEPKPKTEKVTDTRTPEVKAAEKNCLEIIERVKVAKDPDMVEFLRKQAIAVCEKAKIPQAGIEKMLKALTDAIPFKPTVAEPAPAVHIEEVPVVEQAPVVETKPAPSPVVEIPIAAPNAAPIEEEEDIF